MANQVLLALHATPGGGELSAPFAPDLFTVAQPAPTGLLLPTVGWDSPLLPVPPLPVTPASACVPVALWVLGRDLQALSHLQ